MPASTIYKCVQNKEYLTAMASSTASCSLSLSSVIALCCRDRVMRARTLSEALVRGSSLGLSTARLGRKCGSEELGAPSSRRSINSPSSIPA